VSASDAPVVVVGGGPAGLACAIELRRRGVADVVVLEREQQAGGIPRHSNHQGFGVRDVHRLMSGPRYASRYVAHARREHPGEPVMSRRDFERRRQDARESRTQARCC